MFLRRTHMKQLLFLMCFGMYIAYEMTWLFSLCFLEGRIWNNFFFQCALVHISHMKWLCYFHYAYIYKACWKKKLFFLSFFLIFFYIGSKGGGVNYRKTCRETIGVPVVRATYKKGCVSQISRQNRSLLLKKDQRFGSSDWFSNMVVFRP